LTKPYIETPAVQREADKSQEDHATSRSQCQTLDDQKERDLIEKERERIENIERDKEQEERTRKGLLRMRNRYVIGFLAVNIGYVIILLVLQTYTEKIGVTWLSRACEHAKYTYNNTSGSKVEPVGMTFLFLFGFILLIQTVGMIVHRLGTFQHVVSFTKLELCQSDGSDDDDHDDEVRSRVRRPSNYSTTWGRLSTIVVPPSSRPSQLAPSLQRPVSHSAEVPNGGSMGVSNAAYSGIPDGDIYEEDRCAELPRGGIDSDAPSNIVQRRVTFSPVVDSERTLVSLQACL